MGFNKSIKEKNRRSTHLVAPLAALGLFAIVDHASDVHVHFVVDLNRVTGEKKETPASFIRDSVYIVGATIADK